MGYTLTIGNAELHSEWPGECGPEARWTIPVVELPDAPLSPDITGRSNERSPGYIGWDRFVAAVGLRDVFFDKNRGDCLIAQHPGIVPLTHNHLAAFERAQREYVAAHPGSKPGACGCATCDPFPASDNKPSHDPAFDFNLVRLEWLVWWTRWALKKCERPAFENT